MPLVEASIFINAEPEKVYELANDMEAFPKFMADVESVTVTQRDAGSTVTEWVTNIEGTPIMWTEKDTFYPEKLTINYKLLDGDLEKFEGDWIFTPENNGTKVYLSVDYDFGIPHLEELIGPTLTSKVKDNSDMMLSGMKRHLEEK